MDHYLALTSFPPVLVPLVPYELTFENISPKSLHNVRLFASSPLVQTTTHPDLVPWEPLDKPVMVRQMTIHPEQSFTCWVRITESLPEPARFQVIADVL